MPLKRLGLLPDVPGVAAYLWAMSRNEQRLGLRVFRRERADLDKLAELVAGIAEERYRAWAEGRPDPYGLDTPQALSKNEQLDARDASPLPDAEREGVESQP